MINRLLFVLQRTAFRADGTSDCNSWQLTEMSSSPGGGVLISVIRIRRTSDRSRRVSKSTWPTWPIHRSTSPAAPRRNNERQWRFRVTRTTVYSKSLARCTAVISGVNCPPESGSAWTISLGKMGSEDAGTSREENVCYPVDSISRFISCRYLRATAKI